MKLSLPTIFLVFTALTLLSCSSEPTAPEDLLEDERYISVFTELLVINQLDEEQLNGVSRDYLKEQVFEEYYITRKQFERTHSYYQQKPKQQIQRLEKIEESLTVERDRLQNQLNEDRKQLADTLVTPDTLSSPDPLDKINNND